MAISTRHLGTIRVLRRVLVCIALLLVTFAGFAVDPDPAYACSCQQTTAADALAKSDVVFFATVRGNETVKKPELHEEITFKVDRVFKGDAYAEQVVLTPPAGGACGMVPSVGGQWVIFASQGTSEDAAAVLTTSLCHGNFFTTSPPSLLGQSYAPLPGSSDQVNRAGRLDDALTRGFVVGGLVILVLMAVSGVALALLWRPGRRH